MYEDAYTSPVCDSSQEKSTQLFINSRMDRIMMVHLHNGILNSNEKKLQLLIFLKMSYIFSGIVHNKTYKT